MTNLRLSQVLCLLTIILNVAIATFGVRAGFQHEFVTFFGLGLSLFVECLMNLVFLMKLLSPQPDQVLKFEKWIILLVGSFYVQLALVITFLSLFKLNRHEGPDITIDGVWGGVILVIMHLLLWVAKNRKLKELNLQVLYLDANSNIYVLKLAVTLSLISTIKWISPELWWIDSFGALFLAFQIGREGLTQLKASRRSDLNPGSVH